MIDSLCTYLDEDEIGVLLYGSWARRQAGPESDLDILTLSNVGVNRSVANAPDNLGLSRYTPVQLRSANRTLFGMHLARDGIILYDPEGELEDILSTFSAPDPVDLLRRLRELTAIFDLPKEQEEKYIVGLCKLARYILRSAIYATALAHGSPCFSVTELAERYSDPTLAVTLSSHSQVHPPASAAVLDDLLRRLEDWVGERSKNPYRTLHALIVGSWESNVELAHLATLALGSRDALPYSEVPKVIL